MNGHSDAVLESKHSWGKVVMVGRGRGAKKMCPVPYLPQMSKDKFQSWKLCVGYRWILVLKSKFKERKKKNTADMSQTNAIWENLEMVFGNKSFLSPQPLLPGTECLPAPGNRHPQWGRRVAILCAPAVGASCRGVLFLLSALPCLLKQVWWKWKSNLA